MSTKFNKLINLIFYQFQLIKLLVSFIGYKVNPKPEIVYFCMSIFSFSSI